MTDRGDSDSTNAPPALSGWAARSVSGRLPEFPWDRLTPFKDHASAHSGDLVDLSIGTPVDPTPTAVQQALASASDSPGYPTVWGSPELRASIRDYLTRRVGSVPLTDDCVLPTIGSKELVASLPSQLGVHRGQTVLIPRLAYPTYAVGALLAGADIVASDATSAVGPADVPLVWVNSPANPTGQVFAVEHLRKVVSWARERGAVVASDECYFECAWDVEPVSVLHRDVNGGSLDSILAVHSLSKRSNLAGYRAAFVVGDPEIVSAVREVRRHSGLMVPAPVQAAMRAALDDDDHIEQQRQRYLGRRDLLRSAFEQAGFRVDHSEASLYLWLTRGEACMETVAWLAEHGILVAPGEFYGAAGGRHVRAALTASDERIEAAADRLVGMA